MIKNLLTYDMTWNHLDKPADAKYTGVYKQIYKIDNKDKDLVIRDIEDMDGNSITKCIFIEIECVPLSILKKLERGDRLLFEAKKSILKNGCLLNNFANIKLIKQT